MHISEQKKNYIVRNMKFFAVFVFSTIISFILGGLFFSNISSVCILDVGGTGGNCGDAMWGIFLFIFVSPILSIVSLILGYMYAKNKKNLPYQNKVDFFFFVLVIISLIFFHFIHSAANSLIS